MLSIGTLRSAVVALPNVAPYVALTSEKLQGGGGSKRTWDRLQTWYPTLTHWLRETLSPRPHLSPRHAPLASADAS